MAPVLYGHMGFPLGSECSSRGVKHISEMCSFSDDYMCATLKFIEGNVLEEDYSLGISTFFSPW